MVRRLRQFQQLSSAMFVVIVMSVALVLTGCGGGDKKDKGSGQKDSSGGTSFVDSRDGKKYRTVKIGEQVWMAENMNYETANSKCYDDDAVNCAKYGRLYNWDDAKAACPAGWHLPGKEEWDTLVDYAGGENTAGKKLKSKTGWKDTGNGTDEYGFAALPGGAEAIGDFYDAGNGGYWWSATETTIGKVELNDAARFLIIESDKDGVDSHSQYKLERRSARCVQGDANPAGQGSQEADANLTATPAEPETAAPAEPKEVKYKGLKMDWAWAITNRGEKPGNEMVAISYSSPNAFEKLTLAVNWKSAYPVKYAGKKKSTGKRDNPFFPTFESIPGPHWKITDGSTVGETWEENTLLLLPESCRDGIRKLTRPEELEPAPAADVEKVQALKSGRKVAESRLLATDDRGGRIALFAFKTTTNGLLILAYINGDKIISTEFTTDAENGEASWASELGPDEYGTFDANGLFETEEGLFIAFRWGRPEYTVESLLIEQDGKWVNCVTHGWSIDMWEDKWSEWKDEE